jgi:oxygen-independent coproporphyrinogen-3 oxidase
MSLTPPKPSSPAQSLYFHFPFCETKCHYCDFYSLGREKTQVGDADRFERALIREIELRAQAGAFAANAPADSQIDTIFFGGGTPSMTPPDSMGRITDTLFRSVRLSEDYEWTMEANPSSISLSNFEAYRSLGVNRISMGVQSLKNPQLLSLGRVHNESEALNALEIVFTAGFENVSTDLLCGVPGQNEHDLRDHIERLSSFPITHLSIYLLTLPPHHAMYRDLPSEEEQLAHLLLIDSEMRARGFEHYEISNFARPGKRARHNLVYWTGGSYLAFGPSAHSYLRESHMRFKNVSSLHKYAGLLLDENRLAVEWEEHLSEEQLELEKWMLAIRLSEGFPRAWLTREIQQHKAAFCLEQGLLETHPQDSTRLRATPRGFALSDMLVKELC